MNNIYLYLKFQKFFNEVQEPYLPIRLNSSSPLSHNPVVDTNLLLNRFTDYRVFTYILKKDIIPLQILNRCKDPPTYYQFFFKASNCTYPLNDFVSISDVIGNKYCFLINKMSVQVIYLFD